MASLTEQHLKHIQPALDAIMDSHARAIVAYHRHACRGGCGDYQMCPKDADRCPTDWTCDDCLLRQMDDYFQNQEANRADHR